MTRMNADGEHDFTKPDGSAWTDNDHVSYGSGFYVELLINPRYIAKKEADQVSYCWDKLITMFTDNMLAGTTLVPDGMDDALSQQELSVRHMALVPRFLRRAYGAGVLDALEQGQKTDKLMRAFIPNPTHRMQTQGSSFDRQDPKLQAEGWIRTVSRRSPELP